VNVVVQGSVNNTGFQAGDFSNTALRATRAEPLQGKARDFARIF
jgi:hypothetical protein